MGAYLNPGKRRYQIAASSEIFVDKTEMIGYLNTVINTSQRYVCVSRPRRFGKTMAADMICAYYGEGAESRALFGKCKISQIEREENELPWDVYLEKFDVIRLVMTDFFKKGLSINEGLIRLQKLVVRDLVKSYPDTDFLTQMICFNQ